MAVQFTKVVNDFSCLYLTSSVIDDVPCSIVAWFKVHDTQDVTGCLAKVGYINDRGGYGLHITGNDSGFKKVVAYATFAHLTTAAGSADEYDLDTWHLAVATFTPGSPLVIAQAFLDAVPGTQNTGTVTDQGAFTMDRTTIGFDPQEGEFRGGLDDACEAHVGFYDKVLSQSEIDQIYNNGAGVLLSAVAPGNLVFYNKLTNAATATTSTVGSNMTLHENSDGIETCEDEPFNQLGEETGDGDDCGPEDEDDPRPEAIDWPQCVLVPADIFVQVVSSTVSPGRSFTDREQIVQPDAGKWRIEYQNIAIRTRAHVLQWREIESALRGRSGVVLIPFYEQAYDSAPVVTMAAGAGIGEIELELVQTSGDDIEAGMHFSHGDWGYIVKRVVGVDDGVTTVIVWPPLRYGIGLLEELDFVTPHTRCRLETDDAMDINLELLRFARPTVAFVEDV